MTANKILNLINKQQNLLINKQEKKQINFLDYCLLSDKIGNLKNLVVCFKLEKTNLTFIEYCNYIVNNKNQY